VEAPQVAAGELAAHVTQPLGIELLEARWVGSGSSRLLRLIVDSDGGISADMCATVSRQFDVLWEAERGERRDFGLEVMSPGPNRPLSSAKDFSRVIGRWVEVRYTLDDERVTVTGQVASCRDDAVALTGLEEPVEVPLASIEQAKIVFTVGNPTPKKKSRLKRRSKRS